ncbi:ROK family protein [Microbacterium sp. NPDC058342]|uniref:ROK family protein n=1 Tax=Microbacterium sp. NPDC058342 TaxID=3346454 RepID=UPI0036661F36
MPESPSIAARVATTLRDAGPATITDLTRSLAVSRTSVEKALSILETSGMIAGGIAPATGAGRPARRYEFAAASASVVGVDIGAATVRVLVCDLAGRVVRHETHPGITGQTDGAAQLSAVIEHIRAALDGLPPARAVGASLPGIVDDAGRVIASVVIPEWSGIDIGARLRDALGCPVSVDNGVRLAAVAEHHLGAAQHVDDLLYVSVGNRIAMGLILGGVPRRGIHHAAGDIGRLAFRELTDATGELRWRSAPSGAQVFSRARAGDAQAVAELRTFIDELAQGIALLTMTVDPSMIVIGGGLSEAHDELISPLRSALDRSIGMPFPLSVTEARLGAAAAAHGALVLAFDRLGPHIHAVAGMPVPPIEPRPQTTASRKEDPT